MDALSFDIGMLAGGFLYWLGSYVGHLIHGAK